MEKTNMMILDFLKGDARMGFQVPEIRSECPAWQ